MKNKLRLVSMLVLVLGVVSLVVGAAFVGLAVQKNNYMVSSLRAQKVTLGLTQDQIAKGELVDNAQAAQNAADTLAQHLQKIAPTYADLMAKNKTGKYDPTDPNNLTYTQGLNMQNSLDLVVLGFGVIQETMATGGALMIIGLAVGVTGLVLFKLSKSSPEITKS